VFRSVMTRSRIVCLVRQDLSIIFNKSAPRFSNSEESEKSWKILSHEGLLLEVKYNLGGSKKLQVLQVDMRRSGEEPIDNNESCHEDNRCFLLKDAMSTSQYTGRLRRESSLPAFRSEIRQQPAEDDPHISEFH
ncbi:Unknown protein, partial [Striga hermonthica]